MQGTDENITMLYAFVRPLAKIGISIFFRKISLSQTENIPKDKPVILACNHPTAFLEPCILACWLDRPLYYLVRGDLFNKKIYNFLLRALHMLPVYRRRDGDYSRLKTNYTTFDACYETLKRNKTLMIFPEGMTVWEYRLRPLQKGLGRITMGFFDKYSEIDELYVVPVGVNYTDAMKFRSDVLIKFGQPIPMKNYWEKYQEQPHQGVKEIIDMLEPAMKNEMVIINDPSRDAIGKKLLDLDRSRRWKPVLSFSSENLLEALHSERAIAKAVNQLSKEDMAPLEKELQHYEIQLSKHGLDDKTLLNQKIDNGGGYLWLILLALPAFLGYWLNKPLVSLSLRTVAKRVKRIEYNSPVIVGMSIGVYLVLSILILLISILTGFWLLLLLLPLLYLTGKSYILFTEINSQLKQKQKLDKVSETRLQELLKMRMNILKYISIKA